MAKLELLLRGHARPSRNVKKLPCFLALSHPVAFANVHTCQFSTKEYFNMKLVFLNEVFILKQKKDFNPDVPFAAPFPKHFRD